MSVALWVQTACVWEACADKVGNVNRRYDFSDTTLVDFLLSAAAIAPVLERSPHEGLARTVLNAVRATRAVCRSNTNLGIILLLTPLTITHTRDGLNELLNGLTIDDSRLVCRAIREASPAGLGHVPDQDVADEPTLPLRQLMALAADRDRVARQYADAYAEVFDEIVPDLVEYLHRGVEQAVCHAQLRQLARHGDSLITRKRGLAVNDEAKRRAALALADPSYADALDDWLRADGHARNPGTTADLLAAGLYILLATRKLDIAATWGANRIPDARLT